MKQTKFNMKFTYKILIVFLIITSCSSSDDSNNSEESSIQGTWQGVSSSLNGNDRGVPSNSIIKFTSNNKTEFIYEGYGNNGEDISEIGSWSKNGNTLTITWDDADAENETYILTITKLTSTSLSWKTVISGEGELIETFQK